ncbi:hypothetical protein OE88DRAFT_1652680 [Heliocybe sulcata]|uniref:Uncharacterized protein n=1 Tax=Heliocybe sulcata TaxID=5364 RepID=A0A5C3NED4_9AGAM|nr:hypothetical protein OE88DRAFT_1652680 [Heliocybe sulcata]
MARLFPEFSCLARRRVLALNMRSPASRTRSYSTKNASEKSPHAQWYSDIVPGMIPVAILGSTIYMGLRLWREQLAHEKHMEEARARVKELEAEVEALWEERRRKQDQAPLTSSVNPRRWFSWG